MQENLQQLLLLINNITNSQKTITSQGGIVATPNIVVCTITPQDKKKDPIVVKVGRFYRPGHDDTFTGIEITSGSMNKPSRLYPVDSSALPRGFTFTRTDIKDAKPVYINI